MSVLVQLIVGQLQLVEGDHLLHPASSRRRRVWVDVNARRRYGIGLPRDHPTRAAIKHSVDKTQIQNRSARDRRWINKQLGPIDYL